MLSTSKPLLFLRPLPDTVLAKKSITFCSFSIHSFIWFTEFYRRFKFLGLDVPFQDLFLVQVKGPWRAQGVSSLGVPTAVNVMVQAVAVWFFSWELVLLWLLLLWCADNPGADLSVPSSSETTVDVDEEDGDS